MSEPPSSPPQPPGQEPAEGGDLEREGPEPFAPAPAEDPFESGPSALRGCGKPAVIGCLVALALLAVGLILLISQSPKLMRFAMRSMESEIIAALPADLEDGERQRLTDAFDGAVTALMAGRVDADSMSNLQRLAALVPRRGETLSDEEVSEIIALLEEVAAVPAPGARRGGPRRTPPRAILRPPPVRSYLPSG